MSSFKPGFHLQHQSISITALMSSENRPDISITALMSSENRPDISITALMSSENRPDISITAVMSSENRPDIRISASKKHKDQFYVYFNDHFHLMQILMLVKNGL